MGEDRLAGLSAADQDLRELEEQSEDAVRLSQGKALGPAHDLRQDVVTVGEDGVEDPGLAVVVGGPELQLQQVQHLLELGGHRQDVVGRPDRVRLELVDPVPAGQPVVGEGLVEDPSLTLLQ